MMSNYMRIHFSHHQTKLSTLAMSRLHHPSSSLLYTNEPPTPEIMYDSATDDHGKSPGNGFHPRKRPPITTAVRSAALPPPPPPPPVPSTSPTAPAPNLQPHHLLPTRLQIPHRAASRPGVMLPTPKLPDESLGVYSIQRILGVWKLRGRSIGFPIISPAWKVTASIGPEKKWDGVERVVWKTCSVRGKRKGVDMEEEVERKRLWGNRRVREGWKKLARGSRAVCWEISL